MLNLLPKIDRRNQQDLVLELRRLILKYCPEWGSISDLESDEQANALIQIYSNMVHKVIERINKAPYKNFTAFLNLIGISPTPPRVSKAPLVFKLKEDSLKNGFVPAGTKVSAQPDNKEEVIFETAKDILVIKPKPVRAVSLDPFEDRWSNQDFLFSPLKEGEEAEIFWGENPMPHRLYLGHSKLFNFDEEAEIGLDIELSQEDSALVLPDVSWYCFGKDGSPKLLREVYDDEDRMIISNSNLFEYNNLSKVKFKEVKGVYPKVLSGYDKDGLSKTWNCHWVYCELKSPLTDGDKIPKIEDMKINLSILRNALTPDIALSNDTRLDLTKDFNPFGDKPAFNDTFYIALGEGFSKENAQITMNVVLSDKQNESDEEAVAATSNDLSSDTKAETPKWKGVTLNWEYWDGMEWKVLFQTTQDGSQDSTITDETKSLTSDGDITFKCPKVKPCSVGGEENYWMRVRITGGNYGEEGKYTYTQKKVTINGTEVNITEAEYTPPSFNPPSIKKLTVSYEHKIIESPEIVLTENNFKITEKTEECREEDKSFMPFWPSPDQGQTFYLAFDQDISNLPVSLFFPLTGSQLGENPVVAWEYWNGRKWLTLSVDDALRHFTRRETLQFTAPSDISRCTLFGSDLYWIRARLEEGGFLVYPKVNAVYSNVVWAYNSNTVNGEIIGSSNGEPNQSFQLSRTPVLPEQKVSVLETIAQGEWIGWEEVKTFSLSGTDSRHYMIDRSTGVIVFGDGKNGMIPPAGVDNLRCDYYYGGGANGNVGAGTVTQMWSNIPEIDSVFNPVAADGGFDQEEPEQARIRGPYTLKSWNRGVTAEDIEWLVREAMPQISRVKCLPTTDRNLSFVPGRASVIVVPESKDSKPAPSQELINEITEYLTERMSAVMDTEDVPRIDVIGPDYVRVGVEANVNYTSPQMGKIIEGRIIDNLKQFLDPIYGGHEKAGWELGRNLYVSEVYAVIKDTPGVDYISDISIKGSVQCMTLNLEMLEDRPFRPNVTYPEYSAVRENDNTIVFALAKTIEANTDVKTLQVKGFKENDRVRLRYRNNCENLVVVSVDGDLLECRTADGRPMDFSKFPEGSDVEADVSKDLTIKSFTLNRITGTEDSFFLKIAMFETRDIINLSRNDEYINTAPLKIRKVKQEDIFLRENELVYSGMHFINKKSEMIFPYLMDKDNNIVHDLSSLTAECLIEQISKEDRLYLRQLKEVEEETQKCRHCFPQYEY